MGRLDWHNFYEIRVYRLCLKLKEISTTLEVFALNILCSLYTVKKENADGGTSLPAQTNASGGRLPWNHFYFQFIIVGLYNDFTFSIQSKLFCKSVLILMHFLSGIVWVAWGGGIVNNLCSFLQQARTCLLNDYTCTNITHTCMRIVDIRDVCSSSSISLIDE